MKILTAIATLIFRVNIDCIPLRTSLRDPSVTKAAHEGVDFSEAEPDGFSAWLAVMFARKTAAKPCDQAHDGVERWRLGGWLFAIKNERGVFADTEFGNLCVSTVMRRLMPEIFCRRHSLCCRPCPRSSRSARPRSTVSAWRCAHLIFLMPAPVGKVRVHRAPLGRVVRQGPPLAARAQQTQRAAEHFISIERTGLGLTPSLLQQQTNFLKLGSTVVA